METISQRLKQKREEMNLSQDQLAKLAGMKQQSLQAIEAGTTKRPRYLVELARALKCEPEWLLFGDEPNKPTPRTIFKMKFVISSPECIFNRPMFDFHL